ncbi:hypothetical protein [uncultured Brachyspira sp.]|uniref:hypothetical protein n=1 Tax=uncultured Brachyspira sp. TaxID=221953 RepID=UPI0025D7D917|nr:hypothetical protein [uncultured Brachyspira sp.]
MYNQDELDSKILDELKKCKDKNEVELVFNNNNIDDTDIKTKYLNSLIGNPDTDYSSEYISPEDKYKAKLETFFDEDIRAILKIYDSMEKKN